MPEIVDAILDSEESAATLAPISITFSPSGLFLVSAAIKNGTFGLCVWDLASCSLAISAELEETVLKGVSTLCWHGSLVYVIFTGGKLVAFNPQTGKFETRIQIQGIFDQDDIISTQQTDSAMGQILMATRRGQILRIQLSSMTADTLRAASLNDCDYSCAVFDHKGTLGILAPIRGNLTLFDITSSTDHGLDLGSLALGTSPSIHQMVLHPRATSLLLVLRDKTVRLVSLDRPNGSISNGVFLSPVHKFQDVVNRWNWTLAGFSHDGELVWATFYSVGQHLVYIWDTNSGALVKMIEGPKEDLFLAAWDPKKPTLITASVFGRLFRWIPEYPVKWSALVPGLEEIDDNVEYIEREDEFDFDVIQEAARQTLIAPSNGEVTVDLLGDCPVPVEKVFMKAC